MLRSSKSVCANLAEGFYAQYSTEYLQSLHRCRCEARETVTHIRYAQSVNQLQESAASPLLTRYEEGCRQLNNLIASIEQKLNVRGKGKPGFIKEPTGDYLPNSELDDDQPSTINHPPSP